MSLTQIKIPDLMQNVGTPIVCGVQSSETDALIEIAVIDSVTQSLIHKARLVPKPGDRNKCYINLDRILDSVVMADVNNGGFLSLAKPANYIKYDLDIYEVKLSGNTWVSVLEIETQNNVAYEGGLDVYDYTLMQDREFYTQISNLQNPYTRFLTNRPKCEKMNKFSSHQLYWANFDLDGTGDYTCVMEINGRNTERFTLTQDTYNSPFLAQASYVDIDVSDTNIFPEIPVANNCAFTSVSIQDPADPQGANILIRQFQGNYSQTASGYCQTIVDRINESSFRYNNLYKFKAIKLTDTTFRFQAPFQSGCYWEGMNLEINYSVDDCNQGNQYSTSFQLAGCNANIFPKIIQFNFTQIVTNVYFPTVFSSVNPGDILEFWIEDAQQTRITEKWCFIWEDVECDKEYVNILFSNSYGGVDTLQFISPKVNYNVEKKQITKNQININKPFRNEYLDYFNGDPDSTVPSGYTPYNIEKLIYDTTTNAELTLYTKFLNENESDQIFELLRSRNVYIEMKGVLNNGLRNGGQLLPAIITTSEQELRRKKIIKDNLIQYEIKMTVASDNIDILDRIIFKES